VFGGDKAAGATLLGINGTIWAITGVLAVFPLNWISPKLGKRNTLIIAIVTDGLGAVFENTMLNPNHPYLIIIPTVLLSAGMLFFFTLGSSMVGDICDENELKVGYRSEGSFYSIFWWFIKLGTHLPLCFRRSYVLTMFNETQVIKVDHVQGSINELQSQTQFWNKQNNSKGKDYALLPDIKKQMNESLKEANDYCKFLNKEIEKKESERSLLVPDEQIRTISNVVNNVIIELNSGIELLQGKKSNAELTDSLMTKLSETALVIKIEKAKMYSLDLLNHFESRLKGAKQNKDITNQFPKK
jgi:hypothetical protein